MNGLRTWCGVALLVAAAAGTAHASAPTSSYVYPSKVEYFPDKANATSVIIHGAFFFLDKNGAYGTPSCGYMYFACEGGSETMCRMQWGEIEAGIGGSMCQGFGTWDMVSSATLRSTGTTPANPDKWDLGTGISPGVSVSNMCPAAQALKCALPTTADMGVQPDMTVVNTNKADMAVAQPLPDLTAEPAKPDLTDTTTTPPKTGGSCTVGGSSAGFASPAALLGALLLVGLIARRRRSA
jgi:hypothetical protein